MDFNSRGKTPSSRAVKLGDLLLAWDAGDFREGEFQQHLLLVVDDVHPGPVDGDDDVIFGQVGALMKEKY